METQAERIEVRGHSNFNHPASAGVRFVIALADFSFCFFGFFLFIQIVSFQPALTIQFAAGMVVIPLALFILQRLVFGVTLGQLLWSVRTTDQNGKTPRGFASIIALVSKSHVAIQKAKFGGIDLLARIAATTSIIMAFAFGYVRNVSHHPILIVADKWMPDPFLPFPANDWVTAPFFYALGAWPKNYRGRPILYTIPYAKGPPTRFAGAVVSRWEMPHTYLVIEGPKTPNPAFSAEHVRQCLQGVGGSNCGLVRKKSLSRHIEEIESKVGKANWSMKWFEVQNPVTAQEDFAHGIWLQAEGKEAAENRVVLINRNGTQQSIILHRRSGEAGRSALALFEKTIRTLRVSSDLKPGRALIDKQLAETDLQSIRGISDSRTYVSRLAEVQTYLLSKISVDPKNHDTYYHLGGTAFMVADHAAQIRTRRHNLVGGALLLMLDEWSAASRPVVESALLYSKDIDANHDHTKRLEELWEKTKKF